MEAIVEHIVNLPVEDILHMDMDLEQKIAREFLECQICMDRCKNPKDLDCRHFFCEDCLVQLVAKDIKCTSIKCPTCRKVTLIPEEGGVAELPSNFYVSSLADVVKQRITVAPSPTTTTTSTSGWESPKESPVLKKLTSTTSASSETSSPSSANSSTSSSPSSSPSPPPPSPPSSPPMKTCEQHTGKELGMVCLTCTEEICYVCMMEKHPQPEHKCKLYQVILIFVCFFSLFLINCYALPYPAVPTHMHDGLHRT